MSGSGAVSGCEKIDWSESGAIGRGAGNGTRVTLRETGLSGSGKFYCSLSAHMLCQ